MKKESVWDYPRPPRLERSSRRIKVVHAGAEIASSDRSIRILETSHPPTYYIPQEDVRMDLLRRASDHTFCEWKGRADYFDLVLHGNKIVAKVAWTYPKPRKDFRELAGYLAFYAHKLDGCYVDGEKVDPQGGSFYGGWITAGIEGPFKGAPGTEGW
jgi:uncharacterized protein (DUF427 family)